MAEKSFEKKDCGKGVFYKKIKVKEEWREANAHVYQENLGLTLNLNRWRMKHEGRFV